MNINVLSKRNIGIGAGVTVAMAMLLAISLGSVIAISDSSIGAANQDATTEDGHVDSVTVEPNLTVEWDGLDSKGNLVVNIDIRIKKDDGGSWSNWQNAYDYTKNIESLEGGASLNFDKKDLISDIGFANSQFAESQDGETDATDVQARITVTASGSTSDTDNPTWTVSVTNESSETDAGGDMGTGISV